MRLNECISWLFVKSHTFLFLGIDTGGPLYSNTLCKLEIVPLLLKTFWNIIWNEENQDIIIIDN
jgi:hypothetical protein